MARKGRPVGSKNKKGGYFHTKSKPMGVEKRNSTRATVIAHLEKFGYITKKSAEDLYNVNNFYQVISNLRGDGFHIELKRGVGGIAEYHLLKEKDLFQDATVALDVDKKPQPTKKSYTSIVLNHIKEHGYISRKEAIEKYGISNISQVIAYLKSLGYKISYRKDICAQREYYLVADSVTPKANDTCGIEEAMTCFTNWDEAIKEMEKKNAEKKVEKPKVKPEPSLKVNKNRQEAILEHLRTHGSINGFEARDKYGCTFLPCIIRDLRKNGYKITTSKTRNSKESNPTFDRAVSCCTYYLSQEDVVETKDLKPENMTVKTSMKEVILDHLKKHKTITSAIAMNKYKCLNLCTIITTLRDEGYNISRSRERKSSDYNTASNRNNSYVVYTLENKMKTIDTYGVSMTYEAPISNFVPAKFEMFDSETAVLGYANSIADNIIKSCELLCGSSVISFGKTYYPTENKIIVSKIETTKRLFKKKYKETQLASIAIHKVKTEIADSLTFV